MGVKNYKVKTTTGFSTYKSPPLTIYCALNLFLRILDQYNALDMYHDGEFVVTYNPFTQDIKYKRYKVTINVPYTEIEIMKTDKGSIDFEEFRSVLQRIKEVYYNEGI